MSKLAGVILLELKFLARTPAALLIIFMAPLAYPFLYSYLYVNKVERDVPVAVVDGDQSVKSRAFIRTLDATESVRVIGIQSDPAYARAAIESGAAEGSIVISCGFERDMVRNGRPVIRVFINSNRFMPLSDVGKGINDAIAATGNDVLQQTFAAKGMTRQQCANIAAPVVLQAGAVANTIGSYGDFMIPAILLLIIQQTLLAGSAMSAAGTRRRARSVPEGTSVVIWLAGKAMLYFAIYATYSALFFTVHYRIWQIPFQGSVLILTAVTAVHLMVVITTGFFIGSFCRSHLMALILCLFSTYPMFLVSGIPWPVVCMPKVVQMVSSVLPSSHFFPAVFAAARLNAGWVDIQHQFLILSVSFAGIALLLYTRVKFGEKKTLRK